MSQKYTQGGKGNRGMFIERSPNIIAAGLPTAQPSIQVSDHLEHYLLQDEVTALVNDSLPPKPKSKTVLPLRQQPHKDQRHVGIYSEIGELINPEPKTKFQALVEDFKNTAYQSYWKKALGQVRDPVPMLPAGFDAQNTCFGKKTPFHGRLCDVVFPPDPLPDQNLPSEELGIQIDRQYCESYKPNLTSGARTIKDTRGRYAKCCLTDDKIATGTSRCKVINSIQADFKASHQAKLGMPHTPNDSKSNMPPDHAFGILKPSSNIIECFTTYETNTGRSFFLNCLKHINTFRRALSKRFDANFFRHLYLELKYYDDKDTGWLPIDLIYDYCSSKYIRFNTTLIEPLLEMWNSFDGSRIEYKTFINVINYREPLPTMPKILDMPADYSETTTTYNDMVKLGQKNDERPMAGLPSGRYFDLDYPVIPPGCCKADLVNFCQESDVRACIAPSTLTQYGITHRDMYAKRSREEVKRVFQSAGERFSDKEFDEIWKEAMKYHSKGWVSFETFKRALYKLNKENIEPK